MTILNCNYDGKQIIIHEDFYLIFKKKKIKKVHLHPDAQGNLINFRYQPTVSKGQCFQGLFRL